METKTEKEDDKCIVNSKEDLLDLDNLYVTNFVKSESRYFENAYEDTRLEDSKEKETLSDNRYDICMTEETKEKQKPSREKYFMSEKEREKRNKIKDMKVLQRLLEVETVKPMSQTNYFIWETLFRNFLKMDDSYTPFLDPNKTWSCFNDSSNRDQSNEDVNNLDKLITTLASYVPEILNEKISNGCTSINQFFEQICDFYGIQYTGLDEIINQQLEPISLQKEDMPSQNPSISELRIQSERAPKIPYNKLRKKFGHNGNRNYQEFYLELRISKYEDLMGENSGIKFNGLNFDEDEKMILGIENEIVIDWLEGIDRRLPDFIEQKYSSELPTTSLYKLQGEISQNLNSHISEIEEEGDDAFQIKFGGEFFENESEANGVKNEMETETEIFNIIDFEDDSTKLMQINELGDSEGDLTKENMKRDAAFQIQFHADNFSYQSEVNGIEDEVKTKNGIFDKMDFTDDSNKLKHVKQLGDEVCDLTTVNFNKTKENVSISSKPKLNLTIETEEMIKTGYSCEKCGKCFQQTDLLIRHKKEIHTGDSKYTCDHCDSAYKSEMILRIHVKTTHILNESPESNEKSSEKSFNDMSNEKLFKNISGEKSFCDISSEKSFYVIASEKLFKDDNKMENHIVIHTGKRPFKCDECDKSYKQKHALKMHKKVHSGIAEYICDVCSKEFYEISTLVKHKAVHSDEKRYTCERCGKCFKRPGEVVRHNNLVHNGEKEKRKMERIHTCEQCGKSFSYKQMLVEHIRVHTGEKPFFCGVCNKSFAKQVNLKVHKRLHTKQFPYKCDMCNSTKNELMQLKKHKLTVHGIK